MTKEQMINNEIKYDLVRDREPQNWFKPVINRKPALLAAGLVMLFLLITYLISS